ncbi:MAG: hypothetical protein ACE149_09290 [Armatimonadota bacterium]
MKIAADSWYDPGLSMASVVRSTTARGDSIAVSTGCDLSPSPTAPC